VCGLNTAGYVLVYLGRAGGNVASFLIEYCWICLGIFGRGQVGFWRSLWIVYCWFFIVTFWKEQVGVCLNF
jgi:hypothetical protein